MKKQILFLVLVLSLTTIIAENPLSVEIAQGQSNFTVNEYFPSIYVSELIKENPNIQSVSITEYGQALGYLNVLGGIGTNFLISPNKNYEVHVNQTTIIQLKY